MDLTVLLSMWISCTILVLLVNMPVTIRHLLRNEGTPAQKVTMWVTFFVVGLAAAFVSAPYGAALILARGGQTIEDDE